MAIGQCPCFLPFAERLNVTLRPVRSVPTNPSDTNRFAHSPFATTSRPSKTVERWPVFVRCPSSPCVASRHRTAPYFKCRRKPSFPSDQHRKRH